jgi:predicted lipid carrier protein YhbT
MTMAFRFPVSNCPVLVSAIGARLPQWPHSLALAAALNAAAKLGLLPETAWRCSKGEAFVVEVLDAGGQACFSYRDGLFRPLFKPPKPRICAFRANLSAFLQLLARQEDPDTLFFNRELSIVGDTELGLLIKNMLDAIEWPPLPTLPIFPPLTPATEPARAMRPASCRPAAPSSRASPARWAPACCGDWCSSFP